MKTVALVAVFALVLTGCTTPSAQLKPQAKTVQLRMDNVFNPEKCRYITEVTGNEGHWYSSIFYGNDILLQGAINDIKNNALQQGANTVYMKMPHTFQTSVSLFGNAYDCPRPSETLKR